jgi:hypothetical protein
MKVLVSLDFPEAEMGVADSIHFQIKGTAIAPDFSEATLTWFRLIILPNEIFIALYSIPNSERDLSFLLFHSNFLNNSFSYFSSIEVS